MSLAVVKIQSIFAFCDLTAFNHCRTRLRKDKRDKRVELIATSKGQNGVGDFMQRFQGSSDLTLEHIFFCYLSLRRLMWRRTALIQDVCCIIRLILMSTAPQMGWPAGLQGWGFWRWWGGRSWKSLLPVWLRQVGGRNERAWAKTRWLKKKKKKKSRKMFHALMSLGRRKQSCNPILIAVDLLNRSSRFKSQQITQKAQGDVERGGRRGLRNQVHLRWYGSSLTSQDWLRGRGRGREGAPQNVRSKVRWLYSK